LLARVTEIVGGDLHFLGYQTIFEATINGEDIE